MSDQPETNFDLLDVPAPAEGVLTPAEFAHTEAPATEIDTPDGTISLQPVPTFVEAVDPQPVDQHAESGYRPVTGGEIKDYLDAKGMGLEGRPSKSEVTEFLAAKRGT